MRLYTYTYQDGKGLRHEGEVSAESKDNAYELLRGRGIRPIKVEERIVPVVRRGLKGLRKRDIWLILALVLVAIISTEYLATHNRAEEPIAKGDTVENVLEGSIPRQILEMPSEEDLHRIFPNASHRYLARYCVPGRQVVHAEDIDRDEALKSIELHEGDSSSDILIKRVVMGMQREAILYLNQTSGVRRLKAYLSERQAMESLRLEDTLKRVARKELSLDDANEILRGMGLQGQPTEFRENQKNEKPRRQD